MSKTVCSLVACALWLAGCDPSIGSEQCIGSACAEPKGLQPTQLNVSFQLVSAKDPAELPIKWRIPRPCSGPCMPPPPISLYRAEGDAVWTAPRDDQWSAIDHVDAAGAVTSTLIPRPPIQVAGLLGSYLSSDPQGRAVVHLQWGVPSLPAADQLSVVQSPGQVAPVTLSAQAAFNAPLGAIATPAGFLLFDGSQGGKVVRLVKPSGDTDWQQTNFPSFARIVGTSAVFSNNGFVLPANDGTPKDIHYGVLSLDSAGAVSKFEIPPDSRWSSAALLQLTGGDYAVAAGSDLFVERFVGDGAGNIDVVVFAASGQLTGYRIERDCVLNLLVFGFTSDAAGNLYVSSLTGTKAEPRGLLCRLSASAPSRCFQAEPQVLLGQIAATSEGVIFAAAGDEILRIELPP